MNQAPTGNTNHLQSSKQSDWFDNNPTKQSVPIAQYLLLGLFAMFWTYSSLNDLNDINNSK